MRVENFINFIFYVNCSTQNKGQWIIILNIINENISAFLEIFIKLNFLFLPALQAFQQGIFQNNVANGIEVFSGLSKH